MKSTALLLTACVALWPMLLPCAAQEQGDYVPPDGYAAPDEATDSEAYDWSGSYIGLSAGLAMGSHETLGVGGIDTSGNDLSGGMLGGHIGQNYQLTYLLLGTETDFSLANIDGAFQMPGSAIACGGGGFQCATNVNWIGSLRGRAGVAMGDFLPYVTAGLAAGGVSAQFKGPGFDSQVGGLGVGWVAGAGIEYAVVKHLTIRGEIMHYDLADVSDQVLGTSISVDTQFTMVRTGLNLKF